MKLSPSYPAVEAGSTEISPSGEPSVVPDARAFAPDAWTAVPIIAAHARELFGSAITPQAALDARVRSIEVAADLPESLAWVANHPDVFPGWLRPFRESDGSESVQFKPRVPIEMPGGTSSKYVSGSGDASPRLPVLRNVEGSKFAIVVEGTKQGMAVMSYAEDKYSIYGLAGIQSWMRDGAPVAALQSGRFDGVEVVVIPDADAASNRNVYDAAVKLGDALTMDGASSVKYVSLSAAGASVKVGIDDYLASVAPDRRAARVARLIERATTKPASSRPAARLASPKPAGDRPRIDVGGERGRLLQELSGVLNDRLGGHTLFTSGFEFVTVESGSGPLRRVPCDEAYLLRKLADAVECCVVTKSGDVIFKYPDSQTMKALTTFHHDLPVLEGVSTVPLVRSDGSIVTAQGYDPVLRQYVWLDESIQGLSVPEHPSDDDVARSTAQLRYVFQDFAFRNEGDRASAFAMLFTPFLRPLMRTCPLFLLNGLQPGVGKGLLANVVQVVMTGEDPPLSSWPRRDEELRKSLTAYLINGSTFVMLDEVKVLSSPTLNAFLTTSVWSDRKLGESKQLRLPNRAMLVATGNNVEVPGDMARRVMNVRLEWPSGSPETREGFAEPKLAEFVKTHRRELLSACLTIIRAYFDRGCPAAETPMRFGSFEDWQDLISGVLAVAGIEGFMSNLAEDRREHNREEIEWESFFEWAIEHFNGDSFTASKVRDALTQDTEAPRPPDFDPMMSNASVALGHMLRREKNRPRGMFRVVEAGKYQGAMQWMVEDMSEDSPTASPVVENVDPWVETPFDASNLTTVNRSGMSAVVGELP